MDGRVDRLKQLAVEEYGWGDEEMAAHFNQLVAERRPEMACSVCGGARQIEDDKLEGGTVRWCPECEGFGSIQAMLANPPQVNPEAKVLRKIERPGAQPVYVMSDRTFRVYYPLDGIPIPNEPGVKHFAHGRIRGKTDQEICQSASNLLSSSGVQYFHEDGTPHK